MKRIFFVTLVICATFSFLPLSYGMHLMCPQALPIENPSFCTSFKTSASCHCVEMGMPSGMCQDMNLLYYQMIARFGSLEKACAFQHDTPQQTCIDDWNCYRHGGKDSQGNFCSSTGGSCR